MAVIGNSDKSETDGAGDLEYITAAAALSTAALVGRDVGARAARGRGRAAGGAQTLQERPLQPIGVSKEAAAASAGRGE